MATLHGILSVRLKDYLGVITAHELFCSVADATTLAQLVTDAQTYFGLLDPVTDAMGVNARFTLLFDSTGLKTGVSVDNRLDNVGLFAFQQSGQPYKFSEVVPSIAEAVQTAGGIDIANADILAWTGWIHTNGTHLSIESKGRAKLDAFLSCQLGGREHRRGLTRVSYRPA